MIAPRPHIDARRTLTAVLLRTPTNEVAERCKVSPRAVRMWVGGVAAPRSRHRAALAFYFGIPADGW